jgi:hypothetical protein
MKELNMSWSALGFTNLLFLSFLVDREEKMKQSAELQASRDKALGSEDAEKRKVTHLIVKQSDLFDVYWPPQLALL